MRIAKFQADDVREALAQVKRELGPEAVIVATRQIRRGLLGTGVEVTAAVDLDEATPAFAAAARPAAAPAATMLQDGDVERILAPLRSELRSLRSFLRPLAENRPDEALRDELASLRKAIGNLAQAPAAGHAAPLPSPAEIGAAHVLTAPSRGRLIALVGPTGVGKTTTIAKLAARAALIARRRVAIVTLDSYRVGGEEQIRAYADLMGVPLHLVTDPAALRGTIAGLDADLIFIDTAGRSPRDTAAVGTLSIAFAGLEDLEIHLALPAGSSAATIDASFARHRPVGVDRLLFTKIDEADDLGELVRAPARLGKPVAHLTNGQRVPEDLEDATQERLVELAEQGLTHGAAEVAA